MLQIQKKIMEYLKENSLELSEENNEFLKNNNSSTISGRVKYIELVKRPEIKLNLLLDHIGYSYSEEICDMVEIMIKYEGYINKTNNEVAKMLKLEEKQIPEDIDYEKVPSMANLKYKNAFLRNDEVRRREYLAKLDKGEAKINSSVAFPCDIVHNYVSKGCYGYYI